MSHNIFISYRRADSSQAAGRLYERLSRELGGEHVFRDVDSIPFGVDFRRVLQEEVARCDVFLAIIGRRWLSTHDGAGRRRLDDPDDFVRIEIEAALARGITVFAVIIDDAAHPTAEQLPAALAQLADVPGFRLGTDPAFEEDARRLIQAIRQAPPAPNRTFTTRERLARAASRAATAALGGAAGAFFLVTFFIIPVFVFFAARFPAIAKRIPDPGQLTLLMGLCFAPLAGAVSGWRHAGILGAVGGFVAGLLGPPVLFNTVKFAAVFLVIGMGVETTARRDDLVAACVLAAMTTALLGGLQAFRRIAQQRSRRRRNSRILRNIAVGLGLGGVLGGTPIALLVFGLGMARDKSLEELFAWLLLPAMSFAALAAMMASIDGALAGWRVRGHAAEEHRAQSPGTRRPDLQRRSHVVAWLGTMLACYLAIGWGLHRFGPGIYKAMQLPFSCTATLTGHKGAVRALAFSSNGELLASGSEDGTVKLWDAKRGKELFTLKGHTKGVTAVSFNPDGEVLASGSDDGTLKLWNVQTGSNRGTLKGHQTRKVFRGPTIAELLDQMNGRPPRLKKPVDMEDTKGIASVCFNPVADTLASGGWDDKIIIWDFHTNEPRLILDPKSDTPGPLMVCFSPDGKILASAGPPLQNTPIKLWDAQTGKEQATLGEPRRDKEIHIVDAPQCLSFSRDGNTLACIAGGGAGTARLWNLQPPYVRISIECGEARGNVLSLFRFVCLAPDGKTVVTNGLHNGISIWDVQSGEETAALAGHTKVVTAACFAPDGRTMASGSADHTIKLWSRN